MVRVGRATLLDWRRMGTGLGLVMVGLGSWVVLLILVLLFILVMLLVVEYVVFVTVRQGFLAGVGLLLQGNHIAYVGWLFV